MFAQSGERVSRLEQSGSKSDQVCRKAMMLGPWPTVPRMHEDVPSQGLKGIHHISSLKTLIAHLQIVQRLGNEGGVLTTNKHPWCVA